MDQRLEIAHLDRFCVAWAMTSVAFFYSRDPRRHYKIHIKNILNVFIIENH